jgi:hypothetical protein
MRNGLLSGHIEANLTVNLVSPDSFDSSNDVFVDTGGTVSGAIS